MKSILTFVLFHVIYLSYSQQINHQKIFNREGGFSYAMDATKDKIYIYTPSELSVFDLDFNKIDSTPLPSRCEAIKVQGDSIYVGMIDSSIVVYDDQLTIHRIMKYDGIEVMDSPTDIDFDSLGNMYVLDAYNANIFKFSPSGTFIKNVQIDTMQNVYNLQIAADGYLYASGSRFSNGRTNSYLTKFDLDLTPLSQFNPRLPSDSENVFISDFYINVDSNLYYQFISRNTLGFLELRKFDTKELIYARRDEDPNFFSSNIGTPSDVKVINDSLIIYNCKFREYLHYFTIDITVDIDEQEELESKTIVFPNPFINQVNIKSSQNLKSLEIVDETGRMIKKVELGKGNKEISLTLEKINSSVLYLLIKYQDGSKMRKKLIKE